MKFKKVLKTLLIVVFVLMVAPELGFGLELLALLNAMGVELILLSLSATFLGQWQYLLAKIEQYDPYFFISPMKDIGRCPGLLAHAIPGSMSMLMLVLAVTAVSV